MPILYEQSGLRLADDGLHSHGDGQDKDLQVIGRRMRRVRGSAAAKAVSNRMISTRVDV